jgi:CRISPR-associated protein Csb2
LLERGYNLRIPTKGSYDEQIDLYEKMSESIHPEGHVDAPIETEFIMQHFDQVVGYRPYVVFDLIGPQVPFSVSETVHIAAMVRSAVLERAKSLNYGSESFRSSVIGLHREHGDFGHRLSYLPIPGIHFETKTAHAIRRVIIADLAGSDDGVIDFVRNNMPGIKLIRPDKTIAACLSIADKEDLHRINSYFRPSREWVSVTPLVLEEYPPRSTTSSWFRKRVLEYSNIDPDKVETAEFIQYPLFKGIPLNKNFDMADNHKEKFTRHMRITFKQSYAGPLSIGTGKDRGLGLFVSSTLMPKPPLSDARKT